MYCHECFSFGIHSIFRRKKRTCIISPILLIGHWVRDMISPEGARIHTFWSLIHCLARTDNAFLDFLWWNESLCSLYTDSPKKQTNNQKWVNNFAKDSCLIKLCVWKQTRAARLKKTASSAKGKRQLSWARWWPGPDCSDHCCNFIPEWGTWPIVGAKLPVLEWVSEWVSDIRSRFA